MYTDTDGGNDTCLTDRARAWSDGMRNVGGLLTLRRYLLTLEGSSPTVLRADIHSRRVFAGRLIIDEGEGTMKEEEREVRVLRHLCGLI